jgi:parallel beta-helix repeat protein
MINIEDVTDALIISGCSIYYGDDDGIDLDNIEGGEISRNTITGAADKGLVIGSASEGIYVANNIITGCDEGISVQDDSSPLLYNNACLFNHRGLTLKNPVTGGTTSARNIILWENDDEVVIEPPAQLDIVYSLIQGDPVFPGTGNLNDDPRFVDLWNLNLYPEENSPLIDAGYGDGAPELDIYFNPRYDAPNVFNTGFGEMDYVDIGVCEYNPESTAVEPSPEPPVPVDFLLDQNFPNPFNSTTRIRYNLVAGDWVEIAIYDIEGRCVYRRKWTGLSPGPGILDWDPREVTGKTAASGVYICRLRQQAGTAAVKMVLLK